MRSRVRLLGLAARTRAEAQQPLRGNRRRGAVDRLVIVERIGRRDRPSRHVREPGRAGIPVGHAVGRRDVDVVIAGRARRVDHHVVDRRRGRPAAPARRPARVSRNSSCSANPSIAHARPRVQVRERRVALLRARAAIRAVGDVEEALVRGAAADVEAIAAAAVVDVVLGRRARVLDAAARAG